MNLLFLGMRGAFSLAALRALLARDVRPLAVMVDRPVATGDPPQRLHWRPPAGSSLPLRPSATTDSIISLAQRQALPLFDVGAPAAGVPLLRQLAPEAIVVACFPRRLPAAWWQPLPCFNLHPSLLPAYRGPAPLFWQFRVGESRMGVTVHLLDDGLDRGDIVAQAPLSFLPGATTTAIEQIAARRGVELLLDALALPELPRRPQSEASATYFPAPDRAACRVPATWRVAHALNFICGAGAWAPFTLDDGRVVDDAQLPSAGAPPPGWERTALADGDLWVRPVPGAVEPG